MPRQAGAAARPRTFIGLLMLVALVAGLHLWITEGVLGEMAGLQPDAPRIERLGDC